MVGVLEAARDVGAPEWWIAGGVIRDVVWEQRFGGLAAESLTKDVEEVFFDRGDLSPDRDAFVERELVRRGPDVPWDAKDQAAEHLWYPARFGVRVRAFGSVSEAEATWREYAVCVAS